VYVRLIGVWPGFVCLDARTSTFPNFVPPSNNILDYNIASKLSGFTSVRDEQTKTQYAYNSVGFVSYDDERAICDKTEYVIDRNLNGYIIWEISGDLMPDLSTPLLDATNNRLNKLDIRCDLVDWEHPKPATQPILPIPKPTLNSLTTQAFLPTIKNKIESAPSLAQVTATTQNSSPVTQIPTKTSPPAPFVKVETKLSVSGPAQYVKPTLGPTKRATTTQSKDDNSLFYPRYDTDGTSVDCRNDGNAPKWMTSEMMRSSRSDCCTSYVSSSWSDRCNANYPFYPNFDTKSCVNDGNHPGWMAGDYLADNKSKCCNKFFRDKTVLEKCTSE
jgi:chitinase